METILCLAHVAPDGSLHRSALEALAGGKMLAGALKGSTLAAGLIGGSLKPAADRIASSGAAPIFGVEGPEFDQSRYSTDALAIETIVREAKATIVIAPSTSRFSRAFPGAAFRSRGRIDSHLTGISCAEGKILATRWYYRQRIETVLSRTQRPWFLLAESGCFAPWAEADGAGADGKGGPAGSAELKLIPLEAPEASRRTAVSGVQAASSGGETIRPDAPLLFVAGAGWTKAQPDGKVKADEAQKLILDFLDISKASLGGSKSLVDLSGEGQAVLPFMTHLNQIGQTGSTPRHPKGFSTCCHGEEPHVVGWRFVNERRAVNLDPACGWTRGKADVVYVADAFQVMAKVNELLRAKEA